MGSTHTNSDWSGGNLRFYDDRYNDSGLWANCPLLAIAQNPAIAHVWFDDFQAYDNTATVGSYAEVSDAGAIAQTDAVGGVLSIATGATDNNESYVSTIAETFKFASGKRLWFETRVQLTEAATDDSNIIVGLSDTVAANSLLDNGGGPMASYDGAVFAKVDGGTVWQFETSNAATQVTTADAGDFDDATWVRLGFYFDGTATTSTITPYVDGTAGTAHSITLSGLEEMHGLLGLKAGGGNAETLLVDYIKVVQLR